MGLVLYSLEVSPPTRCVRMVLEHLELEYQIHEVNYAAGELQSQEFFALNARRRVPVLKDGEYTIAESRAISCYLCNKYGSGGVSDIYPSDPELRGSVDQQLYVSEAIYDTVQKYLNTKKVLFGEGLPKVEFKDDVIKSIQIYETLLTKQSYLCGDNVTIADVHASSSLFMLQLANFDVMGEFPNTSSWLKKIEALPYYKKCNEKGIAILTK
uniref:Glutathione transferase n=2 Tax=Ciona intestinalis TaxID=7719 RepID=F7AE92_CIOIN